MKFKNSIEPREIYEYFELNRDLVVTTNKQYTIGSIIIRADDEKSIRLSVLYQNLTVFTFTDQYKM